MIGLLNSCPVTGQCFGWSSIDSAQDFTTIDHSDLLIVFLVVIMRRRWAPMLGKKKHIVERSLEKSLLVISLVNLVLLQKFALEDQRYDKMRFPIFERWKSEGVEPYIWCVPVHRKEKNMSYKFPKAKATAGRVLAHASMTFEALYQKHFPMIWKIGITHCAVFHWYHKPYGYAYSVEKYQHMHIIFASPSPVGAAFLEAALIDKYRSAPAMQSMGSQGQRVKGL